MSVREISVDEIWWTEWVGGLERVEDENGHC